VAVAGQAVDPDLGRLYHDTRERLVVLLSQLDEAALATAVPACPAWLVRDVVAHLCAVCQDVLAGRQTRINTDAETAAQVARFRDHGMARILAEWQDVVPQFEQFARARKAWPAVIDIASHEQDIRAAVGRPGARDAEVIWHSSDWLLTRLRPPVALMVSVEDAEYRAGPPDGTPLRLATSRFDAFRWRMGRRSRAQLAALDWSGDPAPVLDHLTVFGPSAADIIE
jgi:Mycothiol maleylpyruvate isomerase N-terminal domain